MREIITIPEELKLAASHFSESNFCILENMTEKKYIIFDIKSNWRYIIVPFGGMIYLLLNMFIDSDKKAVYHKELLEICPSYTIESMIKCKPMFDSLRSVILRMEENNKQYSDKTALKCSYIREWKKYRYMNLTEFFSKFSCYLDDTDYPENERQEFFDTIHRIISKNFFVQHDVFYLQSDKGWFHGMTWFATDIDYLFSRELYHLFVDNAIAAPHICPRCGHFYYSNNCRSKYCDLCKSNYNNIRKEYRQKNQARYLHKRINDRLHSKRFSETDLNDFMIESNFYWDIVRQNTPKTPKEPWYKDIKNEEEYKEWLESKLQEYSTRK